MAYLFNLIFFRPLYNALVLLSDFLPGHSIGVAIIALTIIVKLVLLPLQWQMLRTQAKMKTIEPHIKEIKAKYQDKAEQARRIMELHREHKINPLGSLVMLIQLPIVLALYWVFRSGFNFQPALLYSFVTAPAFVGTKLFNLFELTKPSYGLAILGGLTQMLQAHLMMPASAKATEGKPSDEPKSFQEDMMRSMSIQMRYVLPIIIIFIGAGLPAALPLYWVVSSLATVAVELWFRRIKNRPTAPATTG